MAPANLAFVPSDKFGRPKDTDRRLIRSHCMRGKNKRIGGTKPAASQEVRRNGNAQHQRSTIPPPPPADLSLVAYASETDHVSHTLIFETFTKAKHALYPQGLNVNFDIDNALSFQWLLEDATYLHCVLFCTSAVNDISSHTPLRPMSRHHLVRTIALLKERIADKTTSLLDSTVSIVTSLLIVSAVLGDQATAKTHIGGLQQMIRLRGGLEVFRTNPKLHSKLTRVDLAFSLHTGEPPLFTTRENLPSVSRYSTPEVEAIGNSSLVSAGACTITSLELSAVFRDLQLLSEDLNNVSGSKQALHFDEFQSISSSIQYRLLVLQGTLSNLVDESIRLGSLIFLTTTFQLPKGESRYYYLSKRLRECCCALDPSIPELQDLLLWLLLVGAISLYGVDVPWLRNRWDDVIPVDMTWHEARQRAKRILWIDAIHDRLGEYAFHVLCGREKDVKELDPDHASLWTSGWALCPFQI